MGHSVSGNDRLVRRVTAALVLLECLAGFALLFVLARFARSMAAFDGQEWSIAPALLCVVAIAAIGALASLLWRDQSRVHVGLSLLLTATHLVAAFGALAKGHIVAAAALAAVAAMAAVTAWKSHATKPAHAVALQQPRPMSGDITWR